MGLSVSVTVVREKWTARGIGMPSLDTLHSNFSPKTEDQSTAHPGQTGSEDSPSKKLYDICTLVNSEN